MKWSPENTARAIKIVEGAETRMAGYRKAAEKLGTTETAVRCLMQRNGREPANPPRAEKVPAPTPALPPVEEFRLKAQIRELTSTKKQLVADLARQQDELTALTFLNARPIKPITAPPRVGATQRKGVPVLLCSDWHVEEPVDPDTVNGLNVYNLEIADRCIDRLAEAYEWMLHDSRFDCRAGVVWLGGDLMSGYIHDDLVESNLLSPTETAAWLQDRIVRMLQRIAATTNLERIIVPCNSGNHGRTTEKMRVQTREANSFEWLIYQSVARRLAHDPRFEFQIAQAEWLYLDVMGHHLAFSHGDGFKYGGGVGGISIPIRKKLANLKQHRPIHHACIGHFHTRQDFGDISVNGSMIGTSPYSIRIGAPPEARQQSWFMVDSERGKCISAPVWL